MLGGVEVLALFLLQSIESVGTTKCTPYGRCSFAGPMFFCLGRWEEHMARVMVVDDEDVLLEMLSALIEDLGYEPMTATSGQEALAILSSTPEPPALVLSDVMMPRMNGVELARTIKTDPAYRSVPVLLMSAAFRPPGGNVADHFIHKPFDLDMVAELIAHYLDSDEAYNGMQP